MYQPHAHEIESFLKSKGFQVKKCEQISNTGWYTLSVLVHPKVRAAFRGEIKRAIPNLCTR